MNKTSNSRSKIKKKSVRRLKFGQTKYSSSSIDGSVFTMGAGMGGGREGVGREGREATSVHREINF